MSGTDLESVRGVRETIRRIERIRFENPAEVLALCQEILERVSEEENPELAGLAHFYRGDALYTLTDTDGCFASLQEAIRALTAAGSWEKLGESLNMLGMLFEHRGDYSTALDYYRRGLELLQAHGELCTLGVLLNENCSELCDRTGNLEEARRRALISLEYCFRICDHPQYLRLAGAVMSEIVLLDIRLGRMEQARGMLGDLDALHAGAAGRMVRCDPPEGEVALDEEIVRTLAFAAFGEEQKEQEHLGRAMRLFHSCTYRVDYFWNILHLLQYLQQRERREEMEEILEVLEADLDGKGFPDMQARVSRFRILCDEARGERDRALSEVHRYVAFLDRQREQEYRTLGMLMQVQNSLRDSEQSNAFWLRRAMTDPLTGLPNRGSYDAHTEQLLEKCLSLQRRFAVEMLDIDHFKAVNDSYGHRTGDACLCLLAAVLAEEEEEGRVLPFRYGGDEFAILYIGMSDAQICVTAGRIRRELRDQLEGTPLPAFTISQGIASAVPDRFNRIWDFASTADRNLYRVKHRGGNDVLLTGLMSFENLPDRGER